jgi:hypothetical protein
VKEDADVEDIPTILSFFAGASIANIFKVKKDTPFLKVLSASFCCWKMQPIAARALFQVMSEGTMQSWRLFTPENIWEWLTIPTRKKNVARPRALEVDITVLYLPVARNLLGSHVPKLTRVEEIGATIKFSRRLL